MSTTTTIATIKKIQIPSNSSSNTLLLAYITIPSEFVASSFYFYSFNLPYTMYTISVK